MESKITVLGLSREELKATMKSALEEAKLDLEPDLPPWPKYLTASQSAAILNRNEETFRRSYVKRYNIRTRKNGAAKYLTEDVLRVWRDMRDLVI